MEKTILIISDTELGKKDQYDDFKDSEKLKKFINLASKITKPTTLIFNGDTFDFLKMPYQNNFTPFITKEISIIKTYQIIDAYPEIFIELKNFLNSNKKNKIHFNFGNHDQDLTWEEVQNIIIAKLSPIEQKQISFDIDLNHQNFYVTHGHQQDFFYQFKKKKFIKYKGKEILNIPFGSYIILSQFHQIKTRFPNEEKFYPRKRAFQIFPEFKKFKNSLQIQFFISEFFKKIPFIPYNPVSTKPYFRLFRHFLNYGFEILNDEKFIKKRFKILEKQFPQKKFYVMGHAHLKYNSLNKHDQKNIITDTWREEFFIKSNQKIVKKEGTYLKLDLNQNEIISYKLSTFNNESL